MKKLALLIIIIITASCSNDDECKKVTALAATQTSSGIVYTIQINNGETVITNKATVDFYKHSEAPECYEGMK
jgi:hypothetical protein